MSLKTDFFDGATGLHTKMNDVFDAGTDWVTDNMAAISAALKTNAAIGLTEFTVNISVTADAQLRVAGTNLYRDTFLAGIVYGLSTEDIYSYECTPGVNVQSTSSTSIDLNFTL